jgi:hypothetical protein
VNIDAVLSTLNQQDVDFILIGGVNFMLNHAPMILTFDVDVWMRDTAENRTRMNAALQALNAEWGATEKDWKPVPTDAGWLEKQTVFCVTSAAGALDIFREVKGLETQYADCWSRAVQRVTDTGIPYRSLSDEDMLRCQDALEPAQQHTERIRLLRDAIAKRNGGKQP